MPAYIIVDVEEIHDPETYARYRSQTLATIEKYGGRFVVRGGDWERLEGDWTPGRLVVTEFPDRETALRWYRSEEYAPLAALRQSASRGKMVLVDGVD